MAPTIRWNAFRTPDSSTAAMENAFPSSRALVMAAAVTSAASTPLVDRLTNVCSFISATYLEFRSS
jgi:hypothetical protein